jgi:hypothetical protein
MRQLGAHADLGCSLTAILEIESQSEIPLLPGAGAAPIPLRRAGLPPVRSRPRGSRTSTNAGGGGSDPGAESTGGPAYPLSSEFLGTRLLRL